MNSLKEFGNMLIQIQASTILIIFSFLGVLIVTYLVMFVSTSYKAKKHASLIYKNKEYKKGGDLIYVSYPYSIFLQNSARIIIRDKGEVKDLIVPLSDITLRRYNKKKKK